MAFNVIGLKDALLYPTPENLNENIERYLEDSTKLFVMALAYSP